MKPKILSIGQCGFDHASISGYLSREFNAELTAVDSAAEGREAMLQMAFDLVLVNRIFDRDGDSGIDFIADSSAAAMPLMLVSNYEQHQKKAIAAGAVPGFGKSSLQSPETRQIIANAIHSDQTPE